MTAAYPWLCFAMASCYYLAVSSWFLDYAHYVYKWYTMGSKYNIAKSEQILGVIFYCLQIAVPYTVGLGKRFSILFVILLWFVVDAKF